PTSGVGASFSLSSLGEEVYLYSADSARNLTGYSHGLAFAGSARGVSFGRYVNSVGEEQFPPQLATTLETNNIGPRVGPVVISEIHCVPMTPAGGFVELRNITESSVALFDATQPTNTWRIAGLGFTFPQGVTIPGNGFVLVAADDPAKFRAEHGTSNIVQIFQYSAQLQTNGEMLELLSPEDGNTNGIPYYPVDQVRYGVTPPWPTVTSGISLQRLDAMAYGNDPINWEAAAPTPGCSRSTVPPAITLNARVEPATKQLVLSFVAGANRSYAVQYKDELQAQNWTTLSRVSVLATNRTEVVIDSGHAATRFYRVITPGL
ncbi:MAG TPA: lamin tail domain-containing protein, partial [Clostridia bacterium]|nr:lamin tail domain-containing protein [Clostridia bacterium]